MLLPHSFLFRFVSQPPPLRGTSFRRKEGEPCPCTKAFLHGEGSNARIPLSRTVISSESEKSFSFAVKRCMRVNGNGKPDTPRMWDTVFHANGSAELVRKRRQQRSLGCARDDDTRKCSLPIAFYSAARANLRPYGAPPSIGRRESRVPAPKLSRVRRKVMREYRFPVPSFRAQARNLFRSR